MKIDKSTKVILMLIAIGLFLNAADNFRVKSVEAETYIPSHITITHQFDAPSYKALNIKLNR